jgi:hypothetical protein
MDRAGVEECRLLIRTTLCILSIPPVMFSSSVALCRLLNAAFNIDS